MQLRRRPGDPIRGLGTASLKPGQPGRSVPRPVGTAFVSGGDESCENRNTGAGSVHDPWKPGNPAGCQHALPLLVDTVHGVPGLPAPCPVAWMASRSALRFHRIPPRRSSVLNDSSGGSASWNLASKTPLFHPPPLLEGRGCHGKEATTYDFDVFEPSLVLKTS
jgi:hypothetical protein